MKYGDEGKRKTSPESFFRCGDLDGILNSSLTVSSRLFDPETSSSACIA